MARVRPAFRQADVSRAVKGAQSAGLKVSRVEIDPSGRIVVVSDEAAQTSPASALDLWEAEQAARGRGGK